MTRAAFDGTAGNSLSETFAASPNASVDDYDKVSARKKSVITIELKPTKK